MLRNYIIIAIRNLRRNKLHAFINIIGLTIGFACFIIISLWIVDEYSYDKSLLNRDRIFQLTITHPSGIKDSNVPYILPVLLADDYSEIQNFTRIVRLGNKTTCTFQFEDVDGKHKSFIEQNVMLVDTSFFSIFSFPLIEGDHESALRQPNSIVLNNKIAHRFFGHENPLGKRLTFNGNKNYVVTGVFEQTGKSHIEFDVIIPIPQNQYNDWNWADPAYIITYEDVKIDDFRNKIANYFNLHQPYNFQENFLSDILPISKSYLSFGRMKYIYIFSTVALLTLIIGAINYVNLSYASFTKRIKEMMVRKTAGANKSLLILQIVSESVILSIIALISSIILIELILPSFNTSFNSSLQLDQASFKMLIFYIFPVTIIFGCLTGIFPALFMSGKNLFNKYKSTLKISKFRNYAVISQFVISILLITCSVFILKQLKYIQQSSLGLDPSYIIKVPLSAELGLKFEPYKEELLKNHRILNITCGQAVPFNEDYKTNGISWRGKDPDYTPLFRYSITTNDFIETFGMDISKGRNFLRDYSSDNTNYIVNEEAVRYMDLDNPIGEKITFWNDPGEIIGIVKDFHHVSLHRKILPHIISINPKHFRALKYVFIKVSSNDINETINFIESLTLKILPDYSFEFSFIDQEIEDLYRSEQRFADVIIYFTIITLIICGLGVFGITAFLGEQRSKEIGIRKVYGATNLSIVSLFNIKILKWVSIAAVIAFPISYGISLIWLNNFAYKTTLSLWVILLSACVAVLIGLSTSSYETIKAALKDPVKSLRYE
jgi:ABC-type antimicrobial peptide transport system permease subunit